MCIVAKNEKKQMKGKVGLDFIWFSEKEDSD
jgi:hypothetical protein